MFRAFAAVVLFTDIAVTWRMLRISELYIYPIKSLGGIALPAAQLSDRGFQYDRRWMLVDEQDRFLTQREHPQMALLQPVVTEAGIEVRDRQGGLGEILIPFAQPGTKRVNVSIWSDRCDALEAEGAVNEWFSAALQTRCRLVFMPDDSLRRVDPAYARHANDLSGFSDGYPLLLLSQASLDDLNSRLAVPLPMNRFRPNIVITGSGPYEEDEMAHFRINGIDFYGTKLCARCAITTIDQDTATKGQEPLRTFSAYRRRGNKIYFGQNVLCNQPGTVRVGDEVKIVSRRDAPVFG